MIGAGSESRVGNDGRAADPLIVRRERLSPKRPVGADSSGGSSSSLTSGELISTHAGYISISVSY
jgi:hypothetical protein